MERWDSGQVRHRHVPGQHRGQHRHPGGRGRHARPGPGIPARAVSAAALGSGAVLLGVAAFTAGIHGGDSHPGGIWWTSPPAFSGEGPQVAPGLLASEPPAVTGWTPPARSPDPPGLGSTPVAAASAGVAPVASVSPNAPGRLAANPVPSQTPVPAPTLAPAASHGKKPTRTNLAKPSERLAVVSPT